MVELSWDIWQVGTLILSNSDDIEVKSAGLSDLTILKVLFHDNSIAIILLLMDAEKS